MRLEVLGCSGGLGDGRHAGAYLVDDDILIDAGSGLGRASADTLAGIDHVFLTHAHMDHIAFLPLLVECVQHRRSTPVTVHALTDTIAVLREHVFNWQVWPDFTVLPSPEAPALRYRPLEMGEATDFGGRRVTPMPADHGVPAAGYHLDSGTASLAFTGDTTACEPFWRAANAIAHLRYVVVEVSFHDGRRDKALRAGHLCPSLLAEALADLEGEPEILVTHLKPSDEDQIRRELAALDGRHPIRVLADGEILEF